MLGFWITAALMAALALAVVLVPLLRARTIAGPSSREAALEVLRGQRREIESDIAAGNLAAESRDEALAELLARAGEDLAAAEPAATPPETRRPWLVATAVAICIPALAFGIYAATGVPSASDPKTLQAARPPADEAQMATLVENLARKVRERPDDAQGWSLLARSMAAMGRFEEAAEAYEHLSKITAPDAQLYADWADALGMAQGRSLRGRPRELAERALKLDPHHQKALALAGTAALDAGEFALAASYWQRIVAQLPAGSEDATKMNEILAEVRDRAAAAGKPLPATAPTVPRTQVAQAREAAPALPPAHPPIAGAGSAPAAEGKSVSGSVALDAGLKPKVTGSEILYVFARAENGPRVPLAVLRLSAAALPLDFALDDSQAMAPGMNISSAQSLRVEARISRSGSATAQSGDLVGTSTVVGPGARGVKVLVDKVLP